MFKIQACLYLDVHGTNKILVTICLKHSSLLPAAGIEPTSNAPLHAMPWQCMFAPSLCAYYNLYNFTTVKLF
jgi:hypothetical protein